MNRKLKPPILNTEGIIAIIATVCFIVLLALSYRLAMGFGALITFSAMCVSLIVLIRTGNWHFLSLVLGQFFATILLLMISLLDVEPNKVFFIPIAMLMAVSFTLMLIFMIQRKLKWRSREILELAARPVQEKTNGLTQRPMPAGRHNYSMEELKKFSAFIGRNLIAIPVHEVNRVVLVINIPTGRLLSFGSRYNDCSWVAFDLDGNVSVNISQADYFKYRDLYSFDKLCQSLGDLFIEFIKDYSQGKDFLIIERLNGLNLNIITEG